jgi:L-threonylcarbamoyladenylate synthase
MKTKIIKINFKNPEISKIKEAANTIKNGGLVAFPTETVYGLGANGLDKKATKKIFLVKGRPQDNPLILHISEIKQLHSLVNEIPNNAKKLIKQFWPGPLTIIFKKTKIVPDIVTCGLDTVAIRMPDNKIALELIKYAGVPIAAPSANISGRPSPTNAKHVIEDLTGSIDMLIDGGSVNIGIESTVIDLTQNPPVILRPGKITQKQIEKIIGKLQEEKEEFIKTPKSPGMKYKHYSPKAKVIIIKDVKEIKKILKKNSEKKIKQLNYNDKIKMAKNLFKDFREADKKGYDIIVVKEVEDKGLGYAIMNRLRKASYTKETSKDDSC